MQPRLIIITHEFAPFRGGAATYAEEMAGAMHRAGAVVEVWAPDYGLPPAAETVPCPVVRLRAGGTLHWTHQAQLTRALAARRAQLESATVVLASVGAHLAMMFLSSRVLRRGQRVISLLHGSEVLRFERNPFWRWQARVFYRRVAAVVTVSEYSKSLIEKSFLSPLAGKILIAPCAGTSAARGIFSVEPAHWKAIPHETDTGNTSGTLALTPALSPEEREKKAVRAVEGFKTRIQVPEGFTGPAADGKLRILTLARIHPRKGQLDTARALGRLPEELRDKIIYQIAGTGNAAYLRLIERSCRGARVAFEYLGAIEPDDLAAAYAQCDIYAMTSRTLPRSVEGFGITYLDAGFHGKPVVGYRGGGAVEAVREGETGLLVEEGDLDALARAFQCLILDEGLRARLGTAGRIHAQGFTWDAAARVFMKISVSDYGPIRR